MLQPDKIVVGRRIAKRLKDLDMSIAAFARLVGTQPGNAWKWVHGHTLANVEWWPGICDVLRCTVDDMLAAPLPTEVPGRPALTFEEQAVLKDVLPSGGTPEQRELVLRALRRARVADERTTQRESSVPPPPARKKSLRGASKPA